MSKNSKVCWNCGSKNMKPVDTWYECADCGATHVDIPKPGPATLKVVDETTARPSTARYTTSGSPSVQTQRRAAMARQKAEEKAIDARGGKL